MSGKLFKVKHDEATTCTLGWLKQKVIHDFGKDQIRRILNEAGVKPERMARQADGIADAVYNLHRALDAVYAYRRKQNNAGKRPELPGELKEFKQVLKEICDRGVEYVLSAAKDTLVGEMLQQRNEERTHMEYKPFPNGEIVKTEEKG